MFKQVMIIMERFGGIEFEKNSTSPDGKYLYRMTSVTRKKNEKHILFCTYNLIRTYSRTLKTILNGTRFFKFKINLKTLMATYQQLSSSFRRY